MSETYSTTYISHSTTQSLRFPHKFAKRINLGKIYKILWTKLSTLNWMNIFSLGSLGFLTPTIFLSLWANLPGHSARARVQSLNQPEWTGATPLISLTFHFPSVKWVERLHRSVAKLSETLHYVTIGYYCSHKDGSLGVFPLKKKS